jgi:hypothetical protein
MPVINDMFNEIQRLQDEIETITEPQRSKQQHLFTEIIKAIQSLPSYKIGGLYFIVSSEKLQKEMAAADHNFRAELDSIINRLKNVPVHKVYNKLIELINEMVTIRDKNKKLKLNCFRYHPEVREDLLSLL